MAIPVIDTTTSVLGYRVGEAWMYLPATTNDPEPTSWAWSGLPGGVVADALTGAIQGPATASGVFLARLTATNTDGTCDPLIIPIGIFPRTWGDAGSLRLDIDVRTGKVSPHGITDWSAAEPVVFCKSGDHLILDIGFTSDGGVSLIPLDPSVMTLGIKEYEPDGVIALSDGGFETIGEWDATRYRIVFALDDAKIKQALSNYEEDEGTLFTALCEIEWTQPIVFAGNAKNLIRTTQTFAVQLSRDMIAP